MCVCERERERERLVSQPHTAAVCAMAQRGEDGDGDGDDERTPSVAKPKSRAIDLEDPADVLPKSTLAFERLQLRSSEIEAARCGIFRRRGNKRCAVSCFSTRCCCFCWFAVSMFLLFVFGRFAYSAVNARTGAVTAVLVATPSVDDVRRREHALNDTSVNWCALETTMLGVPPACGRLVIVSLNGTGGNWLRARLEMATHVTTALPACMHGLQFKDMHSPLFRGDCTGMAYSANHLAVMFSDWDAAVAFPHYNPTHAVFVLRNPLDASVEAFHDAVSCGDVAFPGAKHAIHARSADCGGVVSARDFRTPQWSAFALAYADAFVDAVRDTRKPEAAGLKSMVVDYSEFVDSHRVVRRCVEFAREIFTTNFAATERMLRCIDEASLTQSTSARAAAHTPIPTSVAYEDEDLLKRVCAVVGGDVWNREKWGAGCDV